MGCQYENGLGELETISACIEDTLDTAHLRAYVYLEKSGCDSVTADTVILDEDDDEEYNDVRFNALASVVMDILRDNPGYKIIPAIFHTVYNAIFGDNEHSETDEYDDGDDYLGNLQ